MKTFEANGKKYLMIEVPREAQNFVVDNAIEYLTFKIPNYKNWVTDDILENPHKLDKYLATTTPEDSWLTSGQRLHGKYKFLGTLSNGIINFLASPSMCRALLKTAQGDNSPFVILQEI